LFAELWKDEYQCLSINDFCTSITFCYTYAAKAAIQITCDSMKLNNLLIEGVQLFSIMFMFLEGLANILLKNLQEPARSFKFLHKVLHVLPRSYNYKILLRSCQDLGMTFQKHARSFHDLTVA
jgi:hypothetical protein